MALSDRRTLLVALAVMSFCGWSRAEQLDFPASLNDAERAWLAAHPVVRYAINPDYPPIEFVDSQGRYVGMGADYLQLVAGRLGVRFTLVPAENWAEALAKARDREVDLLPTAVDTAQRRQHLLFSAPFIVVSAALVTARQDLEAMPVAEMIRSLKIAVIRGFYLEDYLASEYPDAHLVEAPDIETALQTVSFGVADVMIGDLASTSYFIGKMNITNLRVARRFEPNMALSMAVRKDWPMLVRLLDKALASLTEDEKRRIETTWIHLEAPVWWRNPTYRLAALGSLGALLATIIATLAWNRALARKVRSRTLALEEAHLRLMQSAKLESVGRLAAGVAHEVKNPLAILQMGVDYLAADIPTESEGHAVIADMEDAIHRADAVIKGLLDFSREKKLDVQPVDLNEVLRDSLLQSFPIQR